LPEAAVHRWTRPIVRFLHTESASGLLLLACAVAALVLANLEATAAAFTGFWQTPVGVRLGDFSLEKPLLLWINDGLMTVFFFVVGLEIKRELVAGELRDPRKAALPVLAALGGMLVPAGVYLLLQGGRAGERGWGIPMATDIAFVVGFLALLGRRVPLGLKILLLTLAIADDIGAVVVIAVAYTTDLSLTALWLGLGGFAVVFVMARIGVRWVPLYVLAGALIWLAFLKSGVHPTVAGVALGLMTPAWAWIDERRLHGQMTALVPRLQPGDDGDEDGRTEALERLGYLAREGQSPLERLENALHTWVAFVVMPLFALANAGVTLEAQGAGHPVALAVAAGLFLGKPVGIVLFSWLAVATGLGRLPSGVNWKVMVGAGCLAGVGFTMSIFIASLALPDNLLPLGKLGTLLGSAASAVVGLVLLAVFLPCAVADEAEEASG
jgi:NhaA family Na+:H+ antiporter